MKRMMTLLLAAVLTAALWAGTPLPVQAANEFTPDIVYIKLDQISKEKAACNQSIQGQEADI